MYKVLKNIVWKMVHLLGKIEWLIIRNIFSEKKPKFPPLFIIGLPRTGTTILYQFITNYFEVSYLSNFIARHYQSPFIAHYLSKVLKKNNKHDCFESNYGHSPDAFAPSEAWNFWANWFDREKPYWVPGNTPEKIKKSFHIFIASWTIITKKPLVIKNLRFGQRIRLINELFPDALFIVVKRDPFFTLQSVFLAGEQMTESLKTWCGNKEKFNINDRVELNHAILKQIKEIYEKDLAIIPDKKILEINYEDFCRDPYAVFKELERFFRQNDLRIPFSALPENFEAKDSNMVRVDSILVEKFKNISSQIN